MAVIVGSARIDENGKAHGGAAGNQTGKEVSTQNWYKHSKGWVLLRPKDSVQAEKIAACMESACKNANIGYDQYQRLTLYNVAKEVGFDCAKVTKKVETDCSALVRVCCAYAGIMVANFRTPTESSVLMATGKFDRFTDSAYTTKSDKLKRGDILVTKTQGHTVVVLSNGANADKETEPTLKKGSKGSAVTDLQKLLIGAGFPLPKYGADGDFGEETLKAVKAFQTAFGLEVDGIAGTKTFAALKGAQTVKTVIVTGDSVYVRTGAGTQNKAVGIVHKGDTFEYVSTVENGWHCIKRNGENVYISNKYSELK